MYSPPSPPSPPSPITPPTPQWVIEERRRYQEEQNRKETYVRLVRVNLDKFPQGDQLINFFTSVFRSDMDLNKKYSIAQAINAVTENKNLDDETSRILARGQLRDHALNSESALYNALNIQRNLFAITFFGSMGGVRCNYARSLQAVHTILLAEQPAAAQSNEIEIQRMSAV